MRRQFAIGFVLLLAGGNAVVVQNAPLRFKQEREGGSVRLLSAAELATLGDPLFALVLKNKADLVKLAEVEAALQPEAKKRQFFVVAERIVSDAQTSGRRAVLAFNSRPGGKELQGNVMLSISFGPGGPAEIGEIEAWGWDNHRGRYNYYKLDTEGSVNGQLSWKFRGSSEGADLLAPAERSGTCMRCHVNGAPVMKELFLPWNNWHSFKFLAEYLRADSAHPNKWPAAATPRFRESLAGAEGLETNFLIPAFKRFNQSRLNRALKRQDDTGNRFVSPEGRMAVLEGQRLLRPLFETTEFNFISSRDRSGLHPFRPANQFVDQLPILIPENFFLNTHLIAGSQGNLSGLKLPAAKEFQTFARLTQGENKRLVEKFKVRLSGGPGDTHFGWFVPEPSFIDNNLADQLLRLGAVTPHLLAAVLATDLETPVFSSRRAGLLRFVPDQFEFTPVPEGADALEAPRDAEKDLLTKAVLAAIDQSAPAAGSPTAEFRQLLQSANAVTALDQRVKDYAQRVRAQLDPSNPNQRAAELERLYQVLLDRCLALGKHPVLRNLDETGGRLLLPLPTAD